METIHLVVQGKVQGVYYRASAKVKAKELSIKGWIRNTPDGNVEVRATGEKDQLEKFINWCRQGPRHAAVSDVVITKTEEEKFVEFRIKK